MAENARWRRILLIAALCTAGFLAFWLLLPLLLPFLAGLLLALGVQKPVAALQEKSGLPRAVCSGFCVAALLIVVGGGLFLLLRRLCFELGAFAAGLPELLSGFSQIAGRLQGFLEELAARAPDGLGTALQEWATQLFAGSSGFAARLTDGLLSAAGRFLAALPDLVLFTLTMVISGFMLSSELPRLKQTAKRLLPAKWQQKSRDAAKRLADALLGWCRAQLILMLITFVLVTAGLFLLRMEYALLFGALIALIDALPLLGAGTILAPWGLLMLLQGESRRGVGLLLLYGLSALTRSALEPKLIGRQLGMSPLLTLFALYAGFRLVGVAGMILFPIGAILLYQLIGVAFPHRKS